MPAGGAGWFTADRLRRGGGRRTADRGARLAGLDGPPIGLERTANRVRFSEILAGAGSVERRCPFEHVVRNLLGDAQVEPERVPR